MRFVFDLDGTICFQGKPLTAEMVAALDKLKAEGNEIWFASARPIRDLLPVLPRHMRHYPMVGGNGAFQARDGAVESVSSFPAELVERLQQLLLDEQADYLIDSRWNYAYKGSADHPIRRNLDPEQLAQCVPLEQLKEWVKIVLLTGASTLMLGQLQQLPLIITRHGKENILDLSPQGVDKWTGLARLGMEPGTYVAFGNDANDIPLFQHARTSVCVGGHPDLLPLADKQVEGCEQAVVQLLKSWAESKNW